MDVTKPYKFIGFGAMVAERLCRLVAPPLADAGLPAGSRARRHSWVHPAPACTMDVTKPYKFIGFGAIDATKPYEFIGFGAMDVSKPYKFIGFGAMDVTKPY